MNLFKTSHEGGSILWDSNVNLCLKGNQKSSFQIYLISWCTNHILQLIFFYAISIYNNNQSQQATRLCEVIKWLVRILNPIFLLHFFNMFPPYLTCGFSKRGVIEWCWFISFGISFEFIYDWGLCTHKRFVHRPSGLLVCIFIDHLKKKIRTTLALPRGLLLLPKIGGKTRALWGSMWEIVSSYDIKIC